MARPKSTPKKITCKNCQIVFEDYPSSKKQFCSNKCAQQIKGKDKSWLEKRKATCLEKYGTEIAFQSPQVQEKYKNNLIEKYGVDNPFLINEVKEKVKQTNNERYGCDVASQNKDISNKIQKKLKGRIPDKSTFIENKWNQILENEKINNISPLFSKEYLFNHKLNSNFGNKFSFRCNLCSNTTTVFLSNGALPSCRCNKPINSSIELSVIDFLKENKIEKIILNKRDLMNNNLEIDMYLPDYNLAIEVNGIYWHSEKQGKDKFYHVNKTEACLNNNINLIHITDKEWINKQSIIKSIILNKLKLINNKIHARKCEIKIIKNNIILRDFLDYNHIQGYTHSSINLGLYYNNELVSVMTFGKNRFKKQSNEWEMIRFCNKLNTNIVGGASKLFKYFINNFQENKPIISFADRRFFNGSLYNMLGFKFDKYTSPSYFYWKNNEMLNRISCQKHKLPKMLEKFDINKTEYENMKENGYDRIWDCGNIKFTFT
jgi:hypothetical protein